MGPEGEKSLHVCYIMRDGKPVAQLETTSIGEARLTVSEECDVPLIAGAIGPLTLELRISYPKEWRCSTRKRFIKLLMSHRCDRNTAAEMATVAQALHGRKSYQQLFFEVMALYADAKNKAEKEDDQ